LHDAGLSWRASAAAGGLYLHTPNVIPAAGADRAAIRGFAKQLLKVSVVISLNDFILVLIF
jgi:hypothetical protein